LKELVESARARNIVLAVHHLGGSPKEVENRLEWLVAHDCPDGLIWLRLTPEGVVPTIPSVVVHGAQRDYSQPVLAHVLPDQRKLHDELRTWLRNAAGAGKSRNVPIFCMPEENELETGPSIRNERIRAVKQGIKEAGFEARLVDVADYTGVTAIAAIGEIVKHGGAPVYVCLSDNIAATLLHVLALYREDARHKVLGFDNTNLARSLGFASVDQGLGEIADKVWTLFDACFRTRRRACSQFEEVRVPLRIVVNQKREWAPAH
jgi:hypothetical protein